MSKLPSDLIWEELYRPKTIEECILPEAAKSFFSSIVEKGEMPNMLLTGPAGVGKTTVALALCNELDYEVLMVNGSNEGRLIDTLRNKITQFASSMNLTGQKKCVLIDEADYLPADTVQPALRNFTQEFSKAGVKFIFTCNYPEKIIEPLHSRCAVIDFTIGKQDFLPMMGQAAKRIKHILNEENIEIENDTVLLKMVKKYFPDMRRLLNEMQYKTTTGKLTTDALAGVVNSDLVELTKYLADHNVKEVRRWVAEQPYLSMEVITKGLYDNMYNICSKDSMAQFIITLADWQYKSSFMPDKEIAIVAMFVELMMQCELTEIKD